MNELKEMNVQVSDLEATRSLLAACLNYFQAMDLADAQRKLHAYSESALTQEIDRLKVRYDGYMSDFLLSKYEAEEVAEPEASNDEEEELEQLADSPLGEFKPPKQSGRLLTREELTKA